MNFRLVKSKIVALLAAEEAGRYRTIGYQHQRESAEENLDSDRSVQVFYQRGTLPKSTGGISGPHKHNMVFMLELTASKVAEGQLDVLENPASTPAQIIAAIQTFQAASSLADDSVDELIEIVYQIIQDARNIDFGLELEVPPIYVSSRNIETITKHQPLPKGDVVTITAAMEIECTMDEQVLGETGTDYESTDTVLDIKGDDVEKTGVLVNEP